MKFNKGLTITEFDKNTVKVGKKHEQDAATKPQHQTERNQHKTV